MVGSEVLFSYAFDHLSTLYAHDLYLAMHGNHEEYVACSI